MSKLPVSGFIHNAMVWTSKHSPEILTGVGIAGMITTTVLAVKATPKALQLIEAEKKRKNAIPHRKEETVNKLKPLETVKVAWKPYIPAAVTGVVSTACLIGASSIHLKRNAALATAYTLSQTALAEYREKVIETIGEKKEKAVREKVNEQRLESNPVSQNHVIVTGKGNTLCYEHLSGRYFKSDIEQIRKAVNDLNRTIVTDMYVSLNDFYDKFDLPHTEMGYELGWNIDSGLIDVDFGSQIAEDGTPCIVIEHLVTPRYDFSTFR